QRRSPLVPTLCWPMAGDKGQLTIRLSQAIRVSHITIGHISKTQARTADTPSAPKDISIYGLNQINGQAKFLGSLTYYQSGASFQTFTLPRVHPETFRYVRVHINNNYGNKDYTCLYNIRVHGE
ncbi:hypothetical protein NQD34_003691, partial [Periophthalmus magnuspinnatus]